MYLPPGIPARFELGFFCFDKIGKSKLEFNLIVDAISEGRYSYSQRSPLIPKGKSARNISCHWGILTPTSTADRQISIPFFQSKLQLSLPGR